MLNLEASLNKLVIKSLPTSEFKEQGSLTFDLLCPRHLVKSFELNCSFVL